MPKAAVEENASKTERALSCAECRRLKLRCDRKYPCSTCKRRGCSAICPNGSMITGQGNRRFILADTEQLHKKIAEMSDRTRQLEDALMISHAASGTSKAHPLLARELLKIKSSIELHSAIQEHDTRLLVLNSSAPDSSIPISGGPTATCWETINITADIEFLMKQVESMLNDRERNRELLAQRGALAQSSLDLLQTLCDYPSVKKELRSKLSLTMIGLSEKSGLYPSCLALNDIEKIGEHPVAAGGFGEVWKGLLGGQFTCIKVVKVYGNSNVQKLFKEFLKEAILWRQLDHPNVIPFLGIYFLDTSKERICLISPWMRNGNLMQYLGGDSHESVDRVVLAYDIACGLSYLHEKKVVHGDLKGVNILITDLGRAAITDFGLSRVMESEVFTWTSTSTRTVQGTARWLAPECLIKNQPASFDADVYAFGCVCYEVFTGKQPFYHCIYDPKIVVELMEGKRPMRPLDCSHLSDEIWAIMQGVLE